MSPNILLGHNALHAAFAAAMYCAYTEDSFVVACFLHVQEMTLEPSGNTYPLVLFLSSTHMP